VKRPLLCERAREYEAINLYRPNTLLVSAVVIAIMGSLLIYMILSASGNYLSSREVLGAANLYTKCVIFQSFVRSPNIKYLCGLIYTAICSFQ